MEMRRSHRTFYATFSACFLPAPLQTINSELWLGERPLGAGDRAGEARAGGGGGGGTHSTLWFVTTGSLGNLFGQTNIYTVNWERGGISGISPAAAALASLLVCGRGLSTECEFSTRALALPSSFRIMNAGWFTFKHCSSVSLEAVIFCPYL